MTALGTLALIVVLLAAVAGAVVAWIRWRRWRAEEQDTRLLTGIVDLRRSIRDGQLDLRLPAKGRGFTRDVETAVNRLLDEVIGQFRAREPAAAALTRALDALAFVVGRTVEQLDAAAVQIEGLEAELGRRARTTVGEAPIVEALAAVRAGDDRLADHCQTVTGLADRSRALASECQQAFAQLRACLTELADEKAGVTHGLHGLQARWTTVRASFDEVARVAGATQVLAVNAALAAAPGPEAGNDFDRFAGDLDEVAHGVTHGLERITAAATACEQEMAHLLAAGDRERQRVGVVGDEAVRFDRALAQIHDFPSSLDQLSTALTAMAQSRAQATDGLSAARPDASRLADELQTWTAIARRVGSALTEATGVLAAARHEAARLLAPEAVP
jgi:methyl-accepting chemotaxis protein